MKEQAQSIGFPGDIIHALKSKFREPRFLKVIKEIEDLL